MKTSPGPWSARRSSAHPGYVISAPNGRLRRTIAHVEGAAFGAENAAVMAAAPELLAACEKLCDRLAKEGRAIPDDVGARLGVYVAAARAAIAKAKPEAAS